MVFREKGNINKKKLFSLSVKGFNEYRKTENEPT